MVIRKSSHFFTINCDLRPVDVHQRRLGPHLIRLVYSHSVGHWLALGQSNRSCDANTGFTDGLQGHRRLTLNREHDKCRFAQTTAPIELVLGVVVLMGTSSRFLARSKSAHGRKFRKLEITLTTTHGHLDKSRRMRKSPRLSLGSLNLDRVYTQDCT